VLQDAIERDKADAALDTGGVAAQVQLLLVFLLRIIFYHLKRWDNINMTKSDKMSRLQTSYHLKLFIRLT
jgi:hypothetical protein